LTVLTIALDRSPEDSRPYVERATAQFPPKSPRHENVALVDSHHVVAHRYGIINISTAIWIDEEGLIVRAPAIEYGSDQFKDFHGKESGPHLDAVRRWVLHGELPMTAEEVARRQPVPTQDEQLARAEFALAWFLFGRGDREAAEKHFLRAGQLAPHDWTIRRGSMPIRGLDPMGPDFFELFREWMEAGRPDYESIAKSRG
jgi:hypothetical protein